MNILTIWFDLSKSARNKQWEHNQTWQEFILKILYIVYSPWNWKLLFRTRLMPLFFILVEFNQNPSNLHCNNQFSELSGMQRMGYHSLLKCISEIAIKNWNIITVRRVMWYFVVILVKECVSKHLQKLIYPPHWIQNQ